MIISTARRYRRDCGGCWAAGQVFQSPVNRQGSAVVPSRHDRRTKSMDGATLCAASFIKRPASNGVQSHPASARQPYVRSPRLRTREASATADALCSTGASPRRCSWQLSLCRSAALCKKYSPQIGCVAENAGFFHGLGPLGARRHRARLFERRQRVGFQIGPGTRGFIFLNHKVQSYVSRAEFVCSVFDSGT